MDDLSSITRHLLQFSPDALIVIDSARHRAVCQRHDGRAVRLYTRASGRPVGGDAGARKIPDPPWRPRARLSARSDQPRNGRPHRRFVRQARGRLRIPGGHPPCTLLRRRQDIRRGGHSRYDRPARHRRRPDCRTRRSGPRKPGQDSVSRHGQPRLAPAAADDPPVQCLDARVDGRDSGSARPAAAPAARHRWDEQDAQFPSRCHAARVGCHRAAACAGRIGRGSRRSCRRIRAGGRHQELASGIRGYAGGDNDRSHPVHSAAAESYRQCAEVHRERIRARRAERGGRRR